MTAKDHNKLLGIFNLVQGGLQAFAGLIVALIYGGLGVGFLANARRGDEQMMGTVFVVMAIVVGFIFIAIAGVTLMAGWKLLKEKPGARTWGIVSSIVALFSFPLGTALGVYGLWFLFGDQGKQFYLGGGANQNMFNQPPPPPNYWQ